MKEHPILFSTPMVNAILEGRKTQTRRVIKPQPHSDSYSISKVPYYIELENHWNKWSITDEHGETRLVNCPYGKPGDILWVRETFAPPTKTNCTEYKADWLGDELKAFFDKDHKWKPSIHMPKDAARIWLQIIDIRVERLQDISHESAIAEGIELLPNGNYQNYLKKIKIPSWPTAYHSFQSLWESIHSSESWNKNPWLWVVEFKVLSTTGKPSNLYKSNL
jgi:hypothetical protein